MQDIVFNADSYDVLLAEARRLGFIRLDMQKNEHIINAGRLSDGGSFVLNYVGTIYEPFPADIDLENLPQQTPRPGVWGRLRVNGSSENLPKFSDAITQFTYSEKLQAWTQDGVTPAPEFVKDIGLIM